MRAYRKVRGFTLVELMIVVAMVGVLAALGIASARQYLQVAKTAEARNMLGGMMRAVCTAFDRELLASELKTAGGASAGSSITLCGSSTSVPTNFASVQNRKYTPIPTGDYFASVPGVNDRFNGWQCLKYENSSPQYYQYKYTKGTAPAIATLFTAPPGTSWLCEAVGDIDNDGILANFVMVGATGSGATITTTATAEVNADE